MILDRGLDCAKCNELFKKDGFKPDCITPKGCHIEDLAKDPDIAEDIRKYIEAKYCYESTGLAETQQGAFRDLGILGDPATINSLEKIWNKARDIDREKQRAKAQRNRNAVCS